MKFDKITRENVAKLKAEACVDLAMTHVANIVNVYTKPAMMAKAATDQDAPDTDGQAGGDYDQGRFAQGTDSRPSEFGETMSAPQPKVDKKQRQKNVLQQPRLQE